MSGLGLLIEMKFGIRSAFAKRHQIARFDSEVVSPPTEVGDTYEWTPLRGRCGGAFRDVQLTQIGLAFSEVAREVISGLIGADRLRWFEFELEAEGEQRAYFFVSKLAEGDGDESERSDGAVDVDVSHLGEVRVSADGKQRIIDAALTGLAWTDPDTLDLSRQEFGLPASQLESALVHRLQSEDRILGNIGWGSMTYPVKLEEFGRQVDEIVPHLRDDGNYDFVRITSGLTHQDDLVWIPDLGLYGLYDPDHAQLLVFLDIAWSDIEAEAWFYLNVQDSPIDKVYGDRVEPGVPYDYLDGESRKA